MVKEKGFATVKASHIPDDVALLRKLRDEDFLISTPSQDYDDSYCIQYAKKMNAYMVTNDKFRDYIDQITKNVLNPDGDSSSKKKQVGQTIVIDRSQIKTEQKWIKSHSISYTFNKDEFLPNPDSKFWLELDYKLSDYKNYSV